MGLVPGKKSLWKYPLFFFLTIAVSMLLLVLSAFLPQARIEDNVAFSSIQLSKEGCYPRIADWTSAAVLDNYTDASMLMATNVLTEEDLSYVLRNPMFAWGNKNPVECLKEYMDNPESEPSFYYTRYWMGFRWILRLAMCYLDYWQVRRYLALLLLGMYTGLICLIGKHVDHKNAMAFAISIVFVRPQVICNSLQFSTCFLIAFGAMYLIPWLSKKEEYDGLFFMEVGMLTMFYDFYTTPLITFGLPMIFLYLIRLYNDRKMSIKALFGDAAAWICGYFFTWFTKLVLLSLFTSHNGLADGFGSLFGWLGVEGYKHAGGSYSPLIAFREIGYTLFCELEGLHIFYVLFAVFCMVMLWALLTRKLVLKRIFRNWPLIIVATLAPIWFVVTAEPIAKHFWFQYRIIAVSYWAAGALLCLGFDRTMDEKKS